MGYSIELFLNKDHIDEEFICSICHDIMKNPTMSVSCEHIFCSSCIQNWNKSSNTCPNDRTEIIGLRVPIRPYMNVLNRFQLSCSFDGCGIISTVGEIEAHYKACDFNPEAIKPCRDNCGGLIKMKEIFSHDCFEYLKQQVETAKNEILQLQQEKQDQLADLAAKDEKYKMLETRKNIELEKCKQGHAAELRLKDKEIDEWKINATKYCKWCYIFLGPKSSSVKYSCGGCRGASNGDGDLDLIKKALRKK